MTRTQSRRSVRRRMRVMRKGDDASFVKVYTVDDVPILGVRSEMTRGAATPERMSRSMERIDRTIVSRSPSSLACSSAVSRCSRKSNDTLMRASDMPRGMTDMGECLVHESFNEWRTKQLTMTTTDVYVRSVFTEDRAPSDEIHARLEPFYGAPHKVERWEPGKIFITLPVERQRVRSTAGDVVFGVSDGTNVYVTAYSLHSGERKNFRIYRDGGTMDVTVGVPTIPGPDTTHFFALFGPAPLTPAMLASTKKFIKLTHPQVLRLFRAHPAYVLRHIASTHARDRAMATLRRVRSRGRAA